MRFKGQLNFGSNLGFDRLFCIGCGEERLHRYCKCVSCQTVHSTGQNAPQPWEKLKRYQDKAMRGTR